MNRIFGRFGCLLCTDLTLADVLMPEAPNVPDCAAEVPLTTST